MFEAMTYEQILADMLENVTSEVDKREGSIIWDALAPAALELSRLYAALDEVLKQGFADTAEREYLVLRAAERGLTPHSATCAGAKAEMVGEVSLGAKFYCGGYNWLLEEDLGGGQYLLRAEEAGSGPNRVTGRLTPLEYQENLSGAEIVDIIEPGADEENTEDFRERYFASLSEQSFGGNRADYIEKAGSIAGVGAAKVQAAYNGGGTVRLIVMDSEYEEPDAALVAKVQNIFDPTESSGEGLGLAPIGHKVVVAGAKAQTIDLAFTLSYAVGYQWSDVQSSVLAVIDEYLAELTRNWALEERLVVRVSQMEARMLDVAGIVDVSGLTVNGEAANCWLAQDEFPVRGDVNAE